MAIVASGQFTLVDLNDSKQLQLYIGSTQPKTQIYNPNAGGSYTPNWPSSKPVLTPQLFVAGTATDVIADAKSIKWYVDGVLLNASTTDYTLAGTGVKTLTINTNVLASANTKLFTCEITYTDVSTQLDVVAKADIDFVKIVSGTNSVMAVLSNETHTVPTDANGNNGIFTGAASTMSVYVGTTDESASWSYATTATSCTITGANTRTVTVTALAADTAYVDIVASKSGYSSVSKRFVIVKNKQGITGQYATSYWSITNTDVINRTATGTYAPTTVVVSTKSQYGTAAPADYSGRFIIAETVDGSTWVDKYTSVANEVSKTYTPTVYTPGAATNVMAIRIRTYLAGGTTNLLDEQTIPVIADGMDAIYPNVYTPGGNVVRNADGSLKARMDLYNGSTLLTSGVSYKWYKQDPAATTTVGGDADGGAGWRLMKDLATANGVTNYTTAEITIPASAILSVESFKCVATYLAKKYSNVCTVMDVSDPIQVIISGVNVFKNGIGTTTLTSRLYRAGAELDATGTGGYTYTWYLYDSSNVRNTTWNTTGSKTGKTIVVDSADVDVRGNVLCEISK